MRPLVAGSSCCPSAAPRRAHLRFAALHRLLLPVLDRADGLPSRHRAALFSAFGVADEQAAPDRFFVALAALELIADVGAKAPVVLLVDDLHWVDSASRDAIGFIARRIETERAVLLRGAPGGREHPGRRVGLGAAATARPGSGRVAGTAAGAQPPALADRRAAGP